MTDTPEHVRRKHLEIWLSKPVEERFRLGLELIELVNEQIKSRIRQQHPEYSKGQVMASFVYEMYKDDLPEDYLKDVMRWIQEKHDNTGSR